MYRFRALLCSAWSRVSTICFFLICCNIVIAHSQELPPAQVFKDSVTKKLFENDGSFRKAYGISGLVGKSSKDWVENANSAYAQVYMLGDAQDLQFLYNQLKDKINKNEDTRHKIGSDERKKLYRYHYHAQRFSAIRTKLLQELAPVEEKYIRSVLSSLKADDHGLLVPNVLGQDYNQWSRLNQTQLLTAFRGKFNYPFYQKFSDKSVLADLLYKEATYELMRAYAQFEVSKRNEINKSTESEVKKILEQRFCTGYLVPKIPKDSGLQEPLKAACEDIATHAVQAVLYNREYTELEKLKNRINRGLSHANVYLGDLRANGVLTNGNDLTYNQYLAAFMSMTAGPGSVVFESSIQKIIGRIKTTDEALSGAIHTKLTSNNQLLAGLNAAQRIVFNEYGRLSDSYFQNYKNNPNEVVRLVSGAHPAATARMLNQYPELVFEVADAYKKIASDEQWKTWSQNVLSVAGMALLGVMIVLSGGAALFAYLGWAAVTTTLVTFISITSTVGVYVGIADLGTSATLFNMRAAEYRYYEAALLSGTESQVTQGRQKLKAVREARINRLLSVGGVFLELGILKKLLPAVEAADKARHVRKLKIEEEIAEIRANDVWPRGAKDGGDGFIDPNNPTRLKDLASEFDRSNIRGVSSYQPIANREMVGEVVPTPLLPSALWAWDNGLKTVNSAVEQTDFVELTFDLLTLSPTNRSQVNGLARTNPWIILSSNEVGITVRASDMNVGNIQEAPIRRIQDLLYQRIRQVFQPQDLYIRKSQIKSFDEVREALKNRSAREVAVDDWYLYGYYKLPDGSGYVQVNDFGQYEDAISNGRSVVYID